MRTSRRSRPCSACASTTGSASRPCRSSSGSATASAGGSERGGRGERGYHPRQMTERGLPIVRRCARLPLRRLRGRSRRASDQPRPPSSLLRRAESGSARPGAPGGVLPLVRVPRLPDVPGLGHGARPRDPAARRAAVRRLRRHGDRGRAVAAKSAAELAGAAALDGRRMASPGPATSSTTAGSGTRTSPRRPATATHEPDEDEPPTSPTSSRARGRGLSGSYADRVAAGGVAAAGSPARGPPTTTLRRARPPSRRRGTRRRTGANRPPPPRSPAGSTPPRARSRPDGRLHRVAARARREAQPGSGRRRAGATRAPRNGSARGPLEAFPTLRARRLPELSVPADPRRPSSPSRSRPRSCSRSRACSASAARAARSPRRAAVTSTDPTPRINLRRRRSPSRRSGSTS